MNILKHQSYKDKNNETKNPWHDWFINGGWC